MISPLHPTRIFLTSKLDAPIEIVIGTMFLYDLLGTNIGLRSSIILNDSFSGVSCFVGLAVTCLFLPMNHYAGKVVVGTLPSYMSSKCFIYL